MTRIGSNSDISYHTFIR